MELYGTVRNGVVVLEAAAKLPEGSRVRVEPVGAATDEVTEAAEPILKKLTRQFGGRIKGPSDWAQNHDHYIHGTPKRTQ
jgi:hypothetical protein